jgi:DNA-binding transcriptional MerR regulator
MPEATSYTIGQLAEAAGVTPRTIRYYTAEGLLPRPDARGQYALYSEEHLLRLRLIAQLKEAYLPLSEIKARIEKLGVDEIRVLLDDPREAPVPSTSALDYLAQLRARQQVRQSASHIAERLESYAAAERPSLSLRPPAAPASAAPAPAPTYGFAVPIAAPAESAHIEEAPAPPQVGLLRKLMPQRPARDEATKEAVLPAEQHWRRINVAPGVELHIREPATAAVHERIERLIALAQSLFKADDA